MRRSALKELQRAYNLWYSLPRNWFWLYVYGRWKVRRALIACQRAARSDDPPIAAEAYFLLGRIFEFKNDSGGATNAYNAALNSGVAGYGPNAGVVLGKIFLDSGDLPAAQEAFQRTIGYRDVPLLPWPTNPDEGVPRGAVNWPFKAAVGLEVICAMRGDKRGAQEARSLACELAAADIRGQAELDVRLGEEFRDHGQLSEAEKAYKRAISAKHPRFSAIAALGLGDVLTRKGDLLGALDAYGLAMDIGDSKTAYTARIRVDVVALLQARKRREPNA